MPRTLSGPVTSAIAQRQVVGCHLLTLTLDSGTIRATDADFDVTVGGQTWFGFGRFSVVNTTRESSGLEAVSFTVTLAGPIQAYLSVALQENWTGRPATLSVLFLDATTHQPVDDPVVEARGIVSSMTIAEDGDTAAINLVVDSEFVDFQRARVRMHSDEDQRVSHPTDRFYEYTAEMAEKTIIWPAREFFV